MFLFLFSKVGVNLFIWDYIRIVIIGDIKLIDIIKVK